MSEEERTGFEVILERIEYAIEVIGEGQRATREELGRKLDDVVAAVGRLDARMVHVEADVYMLKADLAGLKAAVSGLEAAVGSIDVAARRGAPPPVTDGAPRPSRPAASKPAPAKRAPAKRAPAKRAPPRRRAPK